MTKKFSKFSICVWTGHIDTQYLFLWEEEDEEEDQESDIQ